MPLPFEPVDTAGRSEDAEHVIDVPDTLERRVGTFLNRWLWRGDRAVVERELRELIRSAEAR